MMEPVGKKKPRRPRRAFKAEIVELCQRGDRSLLQVDKYETKQGFELDRLATNMQAYVKNGPGGWLSSCRGIAEGTSKTLRKALMGELFDIYNKGKGGRKLPIDFLAI